MSKVFRIKLIIYSVPTEFCLKPLNTCAVLWVKQFKVDTYIYEHMYIKSARVNRYERVFPGNVKEKLRKRD